MSVAIIHSRASVGITAPPVAVEVHLSSGLPGFSIVGLPEKVVKESKDRVRSAILNSQLEFPAQRITVNLAPADLPKEGGRFDLAIALGILAASEQIPNAQLNQYEIAGELALNGELRPFKGALPFAIATRTANRQLIIPHENVNEVQLVKNSNFLTAQHLLEICAHLRAVKTIEVAAINAPQFFAPKCLELADVKGQTQAKRALLIAAAGNHSLLMVGPPGAGKTMLASRLASLLPPLNEAAALEVAALYSLTHAGFNAQQWGVRPFRSPHHSASSAAMVGGGQPPKPGEISLAHRGILFLDELPEFNRHVLEALREPLEAGVITISRAAHQLQFPAQFQWIAAMNPCPCGYLGDVSGRCRCTVEQVQRYQARLSGPLLDRFDLQVEVMRLPTHLFFTSAPDEFNTATAQQKIALAKQQQLINPPMNTLSNSQQLLLQEAGQQFGFSARAMTRIIRVARTIANLSECEVIADEHLQEALSYQYFRKARH